MLMSEFIALTGFEPTAEEYEHIETDFAAFDGNTDAFCAKFIQNGREKQLCEARAAEIDRLRAEIVSLQKKLETEREWMPYECTLNVKQADYDELVKGLPSGFCRYMTDEEAIKWVCDEFDFDPAKVTILHEIDEEEIDRHNRIRKTGQKIDRRPIYCATDWHYIRFNTRGFSYEVLNDELRPFWG